VKTGIQNACIFKKDRSATPYNSCISLFKIGARP